jgi:DNA uptake protein ComE-like DNA-binding protein
VYPRLVKILKPGHGMILVWGSIYEEKGDLYLQTHLRFTRKNTDEAITIGVGDRTFYGSLSAQSFAFAPRKMARSELDDIRREFDRIAVVRTAPNDSAKGTPMPRVEQSIAYSYRVLGHQGDWIQIQPSIGSKGWIRANADIGGKGLASRLPEVNFIESLGGYLRWRQRFAGVDPDVSSRAPEWIRAALSRYFESESASEAPLAVAVGEQLEGALAFLPSEASASKRDEAVRSFGRAADRVPYSAEALNLETLARLSVDFARDPRSIKPREVETELTRAVATDPSNEQSVQNLSDFYLFVRSTRAARYHVSSILDSVEMAKFDIAPEQVDEKLATLQAIQLSLPASADSAIGVQSAARRRGLRLVDLNSATRSELMALPGVDSDMADRITAGRPYHSTEEFARANHATALLMRTLNGLVYTGPL